MHFTLEPSAHVALANLSTLPISRSRAASHKATLQATGDQTILARPYCYIDKDSVLLHRQSVSRSIDASLDER